jgi:membrane protein DedA with SNARE-associated domain
MVVESFGLPPVPSEVILPFTGFLVAEGTFSFSTALVVALAGGLVGAFAAYAVGRWWRHRITGLGLGHLRLQPQHLDRMDRFFAAHGEVTVGAARLVPVVRSYISYPAGTAKMPPVRFGIYTLLGSTPFAVALIYAGVVLGNNWTLVSSYFSVLDYVVIALVVVVVVYVGLQIAGVLAPGWPPRRVPAEPRTPTVDSEGASPPH